MITLKSDVKNKEFERHLKKLIKYNERDERKHYEEWHDAADASRIQIDKLDTNHIYYSIRVIKEFLKRK